MIGFMKTKTFKPGIEEMSLDEIAEADAFNNVRRSMSGRDLMIDLETLGRKPGCVILSIGMVLFNPRAGVQSHEELKENSLKIHVDQDSSLAEGFTKDPETVAWWNRQSQAAKDSTFVSSGTVSARDAVVQISEWCQDLGVHGFRVWGNGASFDVPILEEYFDKFKIGVPWSFMGARCYRTLKNILAYDKKLVGSNPLKHDCLYDAIHQARITQAIYLANPQLIGS